MRPLNPWDESDPSRAYVRSESTDLHRSFKAVRKKQIKALEIKKRREVAQAKGRQR